MQVSEVASSCSWRLELFVARGPTPEPTCCRKIVLSKSLFASQILKHLDIPTHHLTMDPRYSWNRSDKDRHSGQGDGRMDPIPPTGPSGGRGASRSSDGGRGGYAAQPTGPVSSGPWAGAALGGFGRGTSFGGRGRGAHPSGPVYAGPMGGDTAAGPGVPVNVPAGPRAMQGQRPLPPPAVQCLTCLGFGHRWKDNQCATYVICAHCSQPAANHAGGRCATGDATGEYGEAEVPDLTETDQYRQLANYHERNTQLAVEKARLEERIQSLLQRRAEGLPAWPTLANVAAGHGGGEAAVAGPSTGVRASTFVKPPIPREVALRGKKAEKKWMKKQMRKFKMTQDIAEGRRTADGKLIPRESDDEIAGDGEYDQSQGAKTATDHAGNHEMQDQGQNDEEKCTLQ